MGRLHVRQQRPDWLDRRRTDEAEYQAEGEKYDEGKKDHLRNSRRSGRNDAKAKQAGNKGNNEKHDGPTEHETILRCCRLTNGRSERSH